MRLLLALIAAISIASQAAASQVFQIDPGTTYKVSGPFNVTGYAFGSLVFDASPGALYFPHEPNLPQDQGGYEVYITINGMSLTSGGTTNPGPSGHYTGQTLIAISENDPFLRVSQPFGFGWYYFSSGESGGYTLEHPAAGLTLTLSDYGSPWLVTPIPEPSTWTMLLIGFAGLGYVARRINAKTRQHKHSPSSHSQRAVVRSCCTSM